MRETRHMNVNFIEGVLDKSDAGLRAVLLAQWRVRVGVAIPVIVADLVLFLTSPNGIPLWFLGLTAGYCVYALSPYSLIRNGSFKVLYGMLAIRVKGLATCFPSVKNCRTQSCSVATPPQTDP